MSAKHQKENEDKVEKIDSQTDKEKTKTIEPKGAQKNQEEEKDEFSLRDLPGVGSKMADTLKEAGYYTPTSIAMASCSSLEALEGISELTAKRIIEAAKDHLNLGIKTANEFMKTRATRGYVTTNSKALDQMLGGGIEQGVLTEFFGDFGSGKTQIAEECAVTVQLPYEKGGLDGKCVYVDTEGSFRPERIKQMATALGLDVEKVLNNIFVARAYNADFQLAFTNKIKELIDVKHEPVKLVVIDSLTTHFRSEYTGRGTLADRQQTLNKYLHELMLCAEQYGLVIIGTNQVMANPGLMFGDPTMPIGGHILGHASKYRIYLRKGKEGKRVAKLIDAPHLPDAEVAFIVDETGVHDLDEKDKK
ncbi:MAG: DNA repair and recombination protein RadA [Candidatus Altiarchaeales archaeon HGW-Altiarchaeales-2]|nr:MAG: DNA repair and recombination protein RadA [Candidatus Altiarchaeales archaeon HGW-Altiarchaeales-2]